MTPVIDMNTGAIINANDVGELRGLLSSAREQGLNVAIIKIPVRLFAIDESYQTPIRTKRSFSYLTENFDDAKLLPVTGVPHDEEGKIYLTDGYGRWKATQILDERRQRDGQPKKYEKLACLVILNAPTEPEARRRFEAEQYAFQNKNVAKVTALQKHGAFECLGHPAALAINELKEKYNFTFETGGSKGNKMPGAFGSYTTLFEICRLYGKDCADFIFDVCVRSGYHLKANGYSTYIMRSLKDMWRYYSAHKEQVTEFLSSWLRTREPYQFKANAVARYGMLDYKTACSLYLEDLIVDNIGLNHVRLVEGKSVTTIAKTA